MRQVLELVARNVQMGEKVQPKQGGAKVGDADVGDVQAGPLFRLAHVGIVVLAQESCDLQRLCDGRE